MGNTQNEDWVFEPSCSYMKKKNNTLNSCFLYDFKLLCEGYLVKSHALWGKEVSFNYLFREGNTERDAKWFAPGFKASLVPGLSNQDSEFLALGQSIRHSVYMVSLFQIATVRPLTKAEKKVSLIFFSFGFFQFWFATSLLWKACLKFTILM